MAKKPGLDTFMADAERHLRACVAQNPNLVCWRGIFPHKRGENTYDCDTIIVGMTDNKESKDPPVMPVMKVWLPAGDGANIHFEVGSDKDTYTAIPFGGGWVPLDELKKITGLLKDL